MCRYLVYSLLCFSFFFFKQKTAYEMRISDWSSDVCSSDLVGDEEGLRLGFGNPLRHGHGLGRGRRLVEQRGVGDLEAGEVDHHLLEVQQHLEAALADLRLIGRVGGVPAGILQHAALDDAGQDGARSEEHTSELQSLMRNSYAGLCLK